MHIVIGRRINTREAWQDSRITIVSKAFALMRHAQTQTKLLREVVITPGTCGELRNFARCIIAAFNIRVQHAHASDNGKAVCHITGERGFNPFNLNDFFVHAVFLVPIWRQICRLNLESGGRKAKALRKVPFYARFEIPRLIRVQRIFIIINLGKLFARLRQEAFAKATIDRDIFARL